MMDSIIIVTENYPFGKGEEFLETEIPYLSQAFSHIHVMSLSEDSELTRTIPSNVSVSRIDASFNHLRKLYVFALLIHPDFVRELFIIRHLYHMPITIRMIKHLLWFMAKGLIIQREIGNLLNRMEKKGRIYLYSYWMHHGAYAVATCRRKYMIEAAVCRAHGFDVYFERNEMKYIPLRHTIAKYLDKMFVISDDGKKYLEELLPSYANKIVVSRLGINNINPKKSVLHSKKDEWFEIISVSNIIEVKRVDRIVEGLSLIEGRRISWTHFGAGKLQQDIEQLAYSKLGDKNNIRYDFKGYVKNQQLMEYYQTHHIDLLINVSESEGIPVTMMEAQCHGVPILATDVGGVCEIVDSNSGILLPPNPTKEQIAESIKDFYDMESIEFDSFRKAALNSWELHYDARSNYCEFVTMIKTARNNEITK